MTDQVLDAAISLIEAASGIRTQLDLAPAKCSIQFSRDPRMNLTMAMALIKGRVDSMEVEHAR